MKKLFLTLFLFNCLTTFAQPWTSNGVCDFVDGTQWNSGGAKGCACSWYTVSGTDTILNCAYGDCGQSDLLECVYDCNGHNGNPTNSISRQCDASATPICWFNGAGNAGELFCLNIALPIELIEFGGNSTDNHNHIFWTTASEIDNDYFILSYSTDGINFEELTQVDGAGTTTTQQNYSFRHYSAKNGVSYYKLKQVDYNGEYKEYPVISVTNKKIDGGSLFSNIYPNPSSDLFYFVYNGKKFGQPINVKIMTNTSKVLLEGEVTKFNDTQGIPFNLDGIDKGVYLVEISQGENSEIKKVMVK
jgi:hypothetical protein